MGIEAHIADGKGGGRKACVSDNNELLIRRYAYSQANSVTAGVINTAYNLIEPKSNNGIVITDILLYANKNVGASDATVTIYENSIGPSSTTESKVIMQTEMLKNSARDIVGIQMYVDEGRWVSFKTDDDDIFATIMWYYLPKAL